MFAQFNQIFSVDFSLIEASMFNLFNPCMNLSLQTKYFKKSILKLLNYEYQSNSFVEIQIQKINLQYQTQNFVTNCYPNVMMSADRQNALLNQDEITDELSRLEDIIHEKIGDIKKVIHDQDKWVAEEIAMKKQASSQLLYPKYDKKMCYYQEFWKIYLMNEIMISKIKDYSVSNKEISGKIEELEEAEKQWSAIWAQKSKKKIRRTSDMIQKNFQCPFPNCGKIYGTDVALNGHMKIKHNSGTKTQREALARQICLAELRGEKININLTFPPGYLQNFKHNFRRQQN